MKKLFKALLVFACAGTLCAGALALSACGSKDTGAYGLVHGAGYVGYSTVKVDGEDKITEVTLTEICFPTQVKDPDGDLYAEVTYGKVVMKLQEDGKTYNVGDQPLTKYFENEANCKAYVDAVKGGKVYVTVNGVKKNDVMTWDALCKDENGYWSTNLNGKLGWKANRDATIKYAKDHGVEELLKVVKATEGENNGYWVDTTGVSTGATWNDLNTRKSGTNSYAELIAKAYNKVAKTPVEIK